MGFNRLKPVFIGFYWVLLGFTGFYWVLLGFTGFYWVLMNKNGYYWVLLGFTGLFYRFQLDFGPLMDSRLGSVSLRGLIGLRTEFFLASLGFFFAALLRSNRILLVERSFFFRCFAIILHSSEDRRDPRETRNDRSSAAP